MRTLLCLLCALAPVLADDPEPKPDPAVEEAIRTLDAVAQDLASEDAAKRAQALKTLRETLPKLLAGRRPHVNLLGAGTPLRVVIGSPFGSDSMSGAWQQDGRKGTYVLRSVDGKGRYELEATLKGGDAEERFEDRGTLKELRAKHPFLKGAMAFTWPAGTQGFMVPGRFDAPPLFGVRVQEPTPELRHHLALPEGAGLVVHEVLPGTRAAKLGLKQHDVLLRIDGELIDTRAQVKRLNESGGVLEIIRRANPRKIDLKKK